METMPDHNERLDDRFVTLDEALDGWLATWGPDGPADAPTPPSDLPVALRQAFVARADRMVEDHRLLRAAFQTAERSNAEAHASGKAGRYRLLGHFREGGMGRVFLAWDVEVQRRVAYKVRKDGLPDHLIRRFGREVTITERVRQPGVVPIYGRVDDDSGRPAYVMEYVEGRTLGEVLTAPGKGDRSEELLHHLLDVCRIVAHAHHLGVVHLDLSLKNILIGSDGRARVLDGGLARDLAEADDPNAGPSRPGTPVFQGPSGPLGLPASPASDVHALGVVLARLIETRPGRPGDPSLRSIVRKATSTRPEDRYPNAAALAEDLQRFLSGGPVSAHRETALERLTRQVRRRPAVAGLSAALGLFSLLALVVVAFLLVRARRGDHDAREQAAAAEAARLEAETQARTLLRLVRERLGSPGWRDEPLGSVTSRDLNAMLPYLRALRDRRPRDRELLANLAWATGAAGHREKQVHNQARAGALLAESSEIATGLVEERPDDPEARRLAVEALGGMLEIGDDRVYTGDWPERMLAACAALELALGPAANRKDLELLTRSRIRAAWALVTTGRHGQTGSLLMAVRETIERSLLAEPNDPDWLEDLDLASRLMDDRQGHLAFLRQALTRAPRAEHVRMALVQTLDAALSGKDGLDESRRAAAEVLEVGPPATGPLERWADPFGPNAWMNVFLFERSLAKAAEVLGRDAEAAPLRQAATRLIHRFVARFPELSPPNNWLVDAQITRSPLAGKPGPSTVSNDDVESLLAEVLDAFEGMDPTPPTTRPTQLARALCTVAFHGRLRGDDGRDRLLARSRALLEGLPPEAESDPGAHLAWSEYWTQMAKSHARTGEPIESVLADRLLASEAAERALDLRPVMPFIRGECVDRLARLARTLAEAGHYQDSRATLAKVEALVRYDPERTRILEGIYRKTADAILIDRVAPRDERQAAARPFQDRARSLGEAWPAASPDAERSSLPFSDHTGPISRVTR